MQRSDDLRRWGAMFKSTPAIAGGRMREGYRFAPNDNRFNPRPPLLAGEWMMQRALARSDAVSIHARHCWRANAPSTKAMTPCKTFQSTPAIAGGRMHRFFFVCARHGRFQSTPAIAGGRMGVAPDTVRRALGFQSTPAIAGGRMETICVFVAVSMVFQSTPAIAGGRMHP